jgi:hypothetical protein
VLLVRDQHADRGAVRRGDDLHCGLRQAGGDKAFADAGGDRLVARERLRAATQDRRVAGLEAERGGIRGDVRPRLVDDADDAQRHAHVPDLDTGRSVLELADLAHGVGERGDFGDAVGHCLDRRGDQRQAVDECRIVPGGFGGGDVGRIRGRELRGVAPGGRRHREKRLVLRPRVRARDLARRGARGGADVVHVRLEVAGRADSGNDDVAHARIVAPSKRRAGGGYGRVTKR